jgi:hypothetical protein
MCPDAGRDSSLSGCMGRDMLKKGTSNLAVLFLWCALAPRKLSDQSNDDFWGQGIFFKRIKRSALGRILLWSFSLGISSHDSNDLKTVTEIWMLICSIHGPAVVDFCRHYRLQVLKLDFTAHGIMEALSEFGLCMESCHSINQPCGNHMLFTLALKIIMCWLKRLTKNKWYLNIWSYFFAFDKKESTVFPERIGGAFNVIKHLSCLYFKHWLTLHLQNLAIKSL